MIDIIMSLNSNSDVMSANTVLNTCGLYQIFKTDTTFM